MIKLLIVATSCHNLPSSRAKKKTRGPHLRRLCSQRAPPGPPERMVPKHKLGEHSPSRSICLGAVVSPKIKDGNGTTNHFLVKHLETYTLVWGISHSYVWFFWRVSHVQLEFHWEIWRSDAFPPGFHGTLSQEVPMWQPRHAGCWC